MHRSISVHLDGMLSFAVLLHHPHLRQADDIQAKPLIALLTAWSAAEMAVTMTHDGHTKSNF